MPRKKNTSGTNLPAIKPTRNVTRPMHGGTDLVPVEAVFHVPTVHPSSRGPWDGEADKIAWTDRMSGLGCIIKRSGSTGCWEGFVGVGPDHPLFGVTPGALVGLDLRAHGGVNYAAACQKYEPESTSVCHVTDVDTRPSHSQRPLTKEGKEHDDAWWLGFSCDQAGDVIPGGSNPLQGRDVPAGVNERVYRDEAFVYRECVRLAAQLLAIADGVDHTTVQSEQPSVSAYDPRRVGG
ncbi:MULTISPECIES: hypothetical protein [Sphingomonas]|uniref:Uncharacterized protein n=1 Tax=Sphingomonas molluscorum TaxID=418184 RepID=A0ABU8Q522_9SPHN|nr:hypothetical protein [Sphingomonas sp. JUb134]MBM7406382.1 hypothetical protein [Sphingomonas sp. JUb134]